MTTTPLPPPVPLTGLDCYIDPKDGKVKRYDQARAALSELERMAGSVEPVSGVVLRDDWPTLLLDRDIKPTDERLYRAAPPAKQPQYEAGDMASAAAQGFRDGVASVAQQPQARPDFTDEWTGYLKDGETPFERFMRERKDLNALTKLYQRALEENERLKAQQPQAEAVQKFVWGYAVRNPKEPQVPHNLAYSKEQADAQSLQFYCMEIIPLVAAAAPQQAEAVHHKPVRVCHIKDVACYEAAVKCGECPDAAPQQAETVPSDVVRDAERWRTFLATRPANTHAVINQAIDDAATRKGGGV